MDEKIISDVEQKIVELFSKKDHDEYNRLMKMLRFNRNKDYADLFVSLSKVSMLIFGRPDFEFFISKRTPRVDINAPILDGLFPLHLAVMTSSSVLVNHLLQIYGAKFDVKCSAGDLNSPFYALTPLELGLNLMRNLIPWTPQMSVHELLCMLHCNVKAKSLMANIYILLSVTPSIRYVISNYSLQGKVVELAALLKAASSSRINFSTMYIPTANIPPGLHFGVPMMLRLLVASRSAALIKEAIQISGNPKEYDENCTRKIKEMGCIRTLLESAERGDLNDFDVKHQLTVELTDGSLEGSQDEFKVNTVAPRYLNTSLFYIEPSKFQPSGAFNSLMPPGYMDSLEHYDGLDIRSCNALSETIFRVLDGRKVDELSLVDTNRFWSSLTYYLEKKSKEAETLTALETNQVMEKKGSTPRLSLPHSRTTDLKAGVSYPLIEAFQNLGVDKISSSVFSAIKKGKA